MTKNRRQRRKRRWLLPLLYGRHGGECFYCGSETLYPPTWPISNREASIDHIITHQNGGDYSEDNCVLACRKCNEERGGEDASLFLIRKMNGEVQC